MPKVTYKGDRPIINSNTAMLITDIALIIANFTMRKVLDIITIVTGILMLGILGGGFFTYKYVTSESFQNKMMDKVLGGVGDMMPKVLDNSLPKMTGPSLPKF
jgi:Na+/citrate or Na+/malate symporter